MHEIVSASHFPSMVLSPCELTVEYHSLPPLQGLHEAAVADGIPQKMHLVCEKKPLHCVKPRIHSNIFKICHVLKHTHCHDVSWHTCLGKAKGHRRQNDPHLCLRILGFSFSPLCHCLSSPDWWEEGVFGPLSCWFTESQN